MDLSRPPTVAILATMLDLYFAPTPNGLKIKLYLEETGLPYRIVPVSLSKGEQFRPEYLAISPNNKIPAIVDHEPDDGGDPLSIFESAVILRYLAEKSGKLLPTAPRARLEVQQWLTWQVAGLGPMAGQAGFFRVFASEKIPFAIDRYTREVSRLYGVLDRRLEGREFIVDELSIADIACYPWIVPHQGHGQDLAAFPNVQRWFESIRSRPATQRTYATVEDTYTKPKPLTDEERAILFGQTKR